MTRDGELLGRGWALTPVVADGGLRAVEGLAHLRQSIFLILTTWKGERIMRPWFGSRLWQYLDAPINQRTLAGMRAEIFDALLEEPRITTRRILIEMTAPHYLTITLDLLVDTTIAVAAQLSYDREHRRWEGVA